MFKKIAAGTLIAAITATTVFAGGHARTPIENAIAARQSHMQLYQFNLGVLGGMARGNVDYDAAAASAAADNLVALTSMSQAGYWLPDSDTGSAENTRALAAIWENFTDVIAKVGATSQAAVAMQAAAGTDLASLQAAMNALGGACGACHKAYRQAR